uniref:SH2 domain-containing protein n=1 Tax=Parastrongyloides trichosuri TaxID=131310 RepID=A0A0N4ZBF1_PARTI
MRGSSYTLNYSIEWLGSFPISKANLENVSKKLDNFTLSHNNDSLPVQLTISLLGVKVTKASDYKVMALQHSLRRICCVVGRPEILQVAYITRETHDRKHRRVCHVFQTNTVEQALEIESILSKAFQAIALFNSQLPQYNKSNDEQMNHPYTSAPRCNINLNPALEETILSANGDVTAATLFKQPYSYSHSRSSRCTISQGQVNFDQIKDNKYTPTTGVKNFDTPVNSIKSQRQLSTVKLISKLFGVNSSSNHHVPNNIEKLTGEDCETPLRPPILKRKPNKRLFSTIARSISGTKKSKSSNVNEVMAAFYSRNNICNKKIDEEKEASSYDPYNQEPEELGEMEYSEKIDEMVYPVTKYLDERLRATRYFVINRSKKTIEKALQTKGTGAFLITYSSSVKHCLTISVHTGSLNDGISSIVRHYVIIRNENGFKIRGSLKYHDTIPTLVTYHSIDKEILPVTLQFHDWPDELLKNGSPKKNKSINSTPVSCTKQSETYDTYKSFKITKSCLKPVPI